MCNNNEIVRGIPLDSVLEFTTTVQGYEALVDLYKTTYKLNFVPIDISKKENDVYMITFKSWDKDSNDYKIYADWRLP